MRNILLQLNYILTMEQKKRGIIVLVVTLIGSVFELLGVAALLPFVQMMLSPEIVHDNWFFQMVCDIFGITSDIHLLLILGIVLIILYIIKNTYLVLQTYCCYSYATKIRTQIATKIMKSYMKRKYSFHLNNNSSVLFRGVGYDVDGAYNILNEIIRIITACLTLMTIGMYLFLSEPFIASFVIGLIVLCILWFFLSFRKQIKKAGNESSKTQVKITKYAMQAFSGIKDILVMQRAEFFEKKFQAAVLKNATTARKKNVMDQIPSRLFEAVCVSGIIGVVCFMNVMGADMTKLVPKMAVFAVAAFQVIPLAGKISSSMNTIMFYRPTLENTYYNMREVNKYEREHPKEESEKNNFNPKEKIMLKNKVEIRNVYWKYDNTDKYILKDLNLIIEKGKSVAFIGPSGAGKSTLADVILGLLEPEKGSVYADDIDIYENKAKWANMVGYVPQTVFLTDDTIRNNIAFGIDEDDINDKRIWEALEQAQMCEFVENLDKKLDTMVGERGVRFSGGQRQRLAIARTLYHNPDVLVLDEATSALDNNTENAVMEAIEALQGVKTIIIIAHRLSTITNCDEVYLIENGKAIKQENIDQNGEGCETTNFEEIS